MDISGSESIHVGAECGPTHHMEQPPAWFSRLFIHYQAPDKLARIYDVAVAGQGPNRHRSKCPVLTDLNVPAWHHYATGHECDTLVLEGKTYGFSLQYRGGPVFSTDPMCSNHHSALQYPAAVKQYIEKELRLGALIGPFSVPPFTPWCGISPLMTLPKSDSNERRVIVDLSFPEGGINAHIFKNSFDGMEVRHTLPSIQMVTDSVKEMGINSAYLASIDISRAYRNFRTCPTDWPLLCIQNEGSYYIDSAMPFG